MSLQSAVPTISLSAEPTLVEEGSQLRWNFNLSDTVPPGGLTVIVSLLEDTDPTGSDIEFLVNGSANITEFRPIVENGLVNKVAVTLIEGATAATLVSTIIDDGIVEEPESIVVGLSPGDGYSIDPLNSNASFTIVENLNLETIFGTSGKDVLFGTNGAENIVGQDGDDVIYGNGGEDVLLGENGNDIVIGTSSSEFINGGYGDDVIYGNGGADILIGSFGDDTIFTNGGADFIDSGVGFDKVWLSNGFATVSLKAGEGYDIIYNFQLGAAQFQVGSVDELKFEDSAFGVQILLGNNLLAVVPGQLASTMNNERREIFVV